MVREERDITCYRLIIMLLVFHVVCFLFVFALDWCF